MNTTFLITLFRCNKYQHVRIFHLIELFLFEFLSPDNRSVWHY